MVSERPIEFDVRTPVPQHAMRQNIAWSSARYGEVVLSEIDQPEVVNIIANGPSALEAPLEGLTVALNGALKLFVAHGIAPTYWAACDPMKMVATFLKDAPFATDYLVASKCDRAVFKALKNREVRIWHIDDVEGLPWAVPCATSVTLVVLSLLRMMGYRRFRLWGWDGCYLDGLDHAVGQPHAGDRISVEVNGKMFSTTTTWAAEAQDAVNQLVMADYHVCVEGPGMVGAILRALAPGAIVSAFNDVASPGSPSRHRETPAYAGF